MTFVEPQLFWIMVLPLALFSFFIVRHKENFTQIFDKEVLERLSVGDDALPLLLRNILMVVALFFMLIALARPVIDNGEQVVQLEGLSAVVALDISGSMRAKDIYPNRLEFAKKKIVSLLNEMPNDEIALTAFAHSSFMLAPFSADKATLQQIIEGVDDNYINMGSTDFKALAHFTSELLEKKEPKILILFTDGGDKKAIEEFSEIIEDNKISLYVVLVGTQQGSPVIGRDGKPLKKNGKIAITQRNDELGSVAMNNSGAYIVANTGTTGIKDLVATIKAHHKSTNQGEITIHDREELFYYPLGLGLFLLLLGFASLPRRR